jgi:hypothetical protein
MRIPRKARFVALGGVVSLAAVVGVAYAAIPDSQGAIHACMLNATGTVRLIDPSAKDGRGHCTQLETEVSWNQKGQPGSPGLPGPQGPPGNADSTVRHISQFMFDGTTVSTPIVSAKGERGRLSIFCGSNPNGSSTGVGHITFTTDNTSSTLDALTFTSPSIPTSTWTQVHGQATFAWADTPNDNVSFEMMIESQIGTSATVPPTLTDIRGFIQHFSFGGCSFYAYIDTSEVTSPMTFTP